VHALAVDRFVVDDFAMTGTAVWAVRDDGKLLCNWVERASFELYQRLRNQ
jgi:hypothetical protein